MLPGGGSAGKALRDAWAGLIREIEPTHFCSLTTRVPVSQRSLERFVLLWLRRFAADERAHFPACTAIDFQERGALHAHAAFRLPGVEPTGAERRWREVDELCWNAQVLAFDSEKDGDVYMANHSLLEALVVCPRTGPCRRSTCIEEVDMRPAK